MLFLRKSSFRKWQFFGLVFKQRLLVIGKILIFWEAIQHFFCYFCHGSPPTKKHKKVVFHFPEKKCGDFDKVIEMKDSL